MTTTFGKLLCRHEWNYIEENNPEDDEKVIGIYLISSNIVYGGTNEEYIVESEECVWKRHKDAKIKYKYKDGTR